ncbi:MAG: galactose-1-phosphate uridylyltransferase [Patescibacteria group bacterium]|mgnify:CR=1 FL=1
MPQLRQNIITGDWVVIAPERSKRPQDFIIPKGVKVTEKDKCPFCLGLAGAKENQKVHMHSTPNIYVIENRYPAFIQKESEAGARSFYPEEGFYRARASIGDHEVVIIKDHDTSLPEFSKDLMSEMFEVIRERYLWMQKNEKVVSIMPIYNHGAEAGASIEHPHAQIFASGIVANTVGEEMDGADKYYGINGACVYCDIVKHEIKQKARLVDENENFIAINFYASRFPFETWIMPKKHESQFELTGKTSMDELASILTNVLKKINKTIDNPPLNFYIHTLPTILEDSASYHWHLEIVPRVSNYGGFELGSEVVINVMSPEEATRYLAGSNN